MKPLKGLFRLLSSFGFAAVLLLFLLALTWLGTLEQVDSGLYEVQKKYFESLGLIYHAGPFAFRLPWSDSGATLFTIPSIPIPMPGVYLLLGLLLLNLLLGGIVRLKKDKRRVGILIAHLGIVMLLVAGFVKFRWSIEGSMLLWPTDTANNPHQGHEFQSLFETEIVAFDAVQEGKVREHLIPNLAWEDLASGQQRTFTSDALPFDVAVTRWFKNCRVFPKGPMFEGDGPVIDGFVVKAYPPDKEAERNMAGVYVTLTEKVTGRQTDAILWIAQEQPLTYVAGGKPWVVDLRRKTFALPFALRLDKFTFKVHPGTGSPSVFLSDVTKFEEGREQALKITMNEPLRYKGYTVYQASYGPPNAPVEAEHYSVFSVVKNPSDQWPKWACYTIALGLLIHFGGKLLRYIKSLHVPPPAPPAPARAAKLPRTEPAEPVRTNA